MMRAELGVLQLISIGLGASVLVFLTFGCDVWLAEKLQRKEPRTDKVRIPRGSWLRLPLHVAAATTLALMLLDLGRPVGGLVVFDEHGVPQRATMQVLVLSGGKSKVEHVMLRAFGSDGETRGVHRTRYSASRNPLPSGAAIWDGEALRSVETLEIVASPEQVRAAIPELAGSESRLLRVEDDVAVFQRRDGETFRVSPSDVVGAEQLGPAGCLVDVSLHRSVPLDGLIEPKLVPWPAAGPGCPVATPSGAQLLRSLDAAFGEQHVLLTLRDGDETRWQVPLAGLTGAEDARLLGAFPGSDVLTVVAADGDELLFSQLGWADGAVSGVTRWK